MDYFTWGIFSDALRPIIRCERKYLMDYNQSYITLIFSSIFMLLVQQILFSINLFVTWLITIKNEDLDIVVH